MSDLNALSIELDEYADDLLDESSGAPSFYQVATALHDLAARLRSSLRQVPEGCVLLPSRLTAENGAKGLLSGEFHETTRTTCGLCDGEGYIEDVVCGDCEGECSVEVKVPVSWDTIKQIHRMVVDNLAVEANPAPPTSASDHGINAAVARGDLRNTFDPPTSGDDDPNGQHCPECKFTMSGLGHCVNCGWNMTATEATPAQAGAQVDDVAKAMVLVRYANKPNGARAWDELLSDAASYADREAELDNWRVLARAAIASIAQAGAELPELPEPVWVSEVPVDAPLFTADQMRAYAELARRGGSDG